MDRYLAGDRNHDQADTELLKLLIKIHDCLERSF